MSSIKEIIITEAVKLISGIAASSLKKIDWKLASTNKDIEDAFNRHVRTVKNWSEEINFRDLQSSKRTLSVYIELNLYLYPKRIRIAEDEIAASISLSDLLKNEKNHIAILGQPGAGKTTSMKFVCQSIFYNENFFPDKFRYPLLVKLRDFNKIKNTENRAGIIIEYLFNTLGLKIDPKNIPNDESALIKVKEQLVIDVLESLNALLIIEGFDELAYKKHRTIVLNEISILSNNLENAKLIITSRTADYTYSYENIAEYEFCSLNSSQIHDFARNWLGQDKASEFVQAVMKSPFSDTTIRPLTIAHLCAIYERYGKIPDKPKTVYRKIVNLLLEEWDEQRNIKRISKYASFEIDRKFEFLSALAFDLTVNSRKTTFNQTVLLNTYKKIFTDFDLALRESGSVVKELESHTGLFIQSGFEIYEFAHKSLQEYLTAEYIVKLPKLPERTVIERLPNELAIAIAISSNPSLYFTEIINERLVKSKLTPNFIQTFINRIILEKPDFNYSSKVGIAALQLYTRYLNHFIDESEQLTLFIVDEIIEEFESFIKEIFKRNNIQEIFNDYEIINEVNSTSSTNVYRLKLINRSLNLPQFLSCRESFLNSVRGQSVEIIDTDF